MFDFLHARATLRFEAMERRLDRAGADERAKIATPLTELEQTIRAELAAAEPDIQQLTLDLPQIERDQLRARLGAIPEEIAHELALIDARYAQRHTLMSPAAVTVLVPRHLAGGLETDR